jgi:hypothetical protein
LGFKIVNDQYWRGDSLFLVGSAVSWSRAYRNLLLVFIISPYGFCTLTAVATAH